jgi:uncharacterized cupin superfamily protein
MSKLKLSDIAGRTGSDYPSPYDQPVAARVRQRLGEAGGLTQFGVNRITLPPGCWSGQRHWHSLEDEFVFVIEGEVMLVTNEGEQLLRAGDCAAFPAGRPNGHQLINRSAAPAACLEVGSRNAADRVVYSDIDLLFDGARDAYTHKDGTPYA